MGAVRPMQEAPPEIVLRRLGTRDYGRVSEAMRRFTDGRGAATPDELWLVEHPPVFTLGVNGSREHVLLPGDIDVVQSDRGGQVTYHGPGQLVLYPLLELRRYGLGPRGLVCLLEDAVIAMLDGFGIRAAARRDAPGVYVDGRKIASIGLRIRRGCSYHGVALNVNLDTAPFRRINPCGYAGLEVTRLQDEGGPGDLEAVAALLPEAVAARLARARGTAIRLVSPPGAGDGEGALLREEARA